MRSLFALCLGFVAIGVLPVQAVFAQVSCGDTITENTKLEGDLICGTGPEALVVEGPAKLNLNGHTVRCTGDFDGIVLTESGAKVSGGTVTGCFRGIFVSFGSTDAHVSRITADANESGIVVAGPSNNNHVVNNTTTRNPRSGIVVAGTNNRAVNNRVYGGDAGIRVESGPLASHLIIDNEVRGAIDGIRVVGLTESTHHQITGNIASENSDDGIEIRSNSNRITGNVTENNGGEGIVLFLISNSNQVSGNLALDNSVDLRDSRPACGDNSWLGNTFETSLAGAVADPDCID